jgi:hypothetical protein
VVKLGKAFALEAKDFAGSRPARGTYGGTQLRGLICLENREGD